MINRDYVEKGKIETDEAVKGKSPEISCRNKNANLFSVSTNQKSVQQKNVGESQQANQTTGDQRRIKLYAFYGQKSS